MTIYQRLDTRNKIAILTDDAGDQLTIPLEQLVTYDGISTERSPDEVSDFTWTEHRSLSEWLNACFVPKSVHRHALEGDRRGRN